MVISLAWFSPRWLWLLLPVPLLLLVSLGFSVGLLLGTAERLFPGHRTVGDDRVADHMWTVPIVYVPGILPAPCGYPPRIHRAAADGHSRTFSARIDAEAKLWIGMMAWPGRMLLIAIAAFRACERIRIWCEAPLYDSFHRVAKALDVAAHGGFRRLIWRRRLVDAS